MIYLKNNAPAVAEHGKTVIGFNLVNGKEVEGDLPSFESRSAVDTRDVVGIFPECGEKDVERAARAAAEAFRTWKDLPATRRGALIGRLGIILAANRERIARVIIREVGRTRAEALAELDEAIALCRWAEGESWAFHSRLVPGLRPGFRLRVCAQPLGVCGVLTSGISPLAAPLRQILPALLAGDTVVWKPSDDAPTVAYLAARALMEAGLPAGVVNVVNGHGHSGCGKHFMAAIDKGAFHSFRFTGSTAQGRAVAEACARRLIPAGLELAGRNPMLVLEDADLDHAVQSAVRSAFAGAGQGPFALGNLILLEGIAEAFTRRLTEAVSALVAGNPLQHPEVACGPLISKRRHEAFHALFEKAGPDQEQGARLLCGGARWSKENRDARVLGSIDHGYYEQPAVWTGVRPEMALFRSETAGPVLNLCTASSVDEALAWAEGAPAVRCAAIHTADRAQAERCLAALRAPFCAVNGSLDAAEFHMPFGAMPLDGYQQWRRIFREQPGRAPEAPEPPAASSVNWEALG